jgi:tRNA (guanine-N7-)-methyltransferase
MMDEDEAEISAELRSFGRRRGRTLSRRQQDLMDRILPRLSVDLSTPPPDRLPSLFASAVSDVWLEIGFGGGEHLLWQAEHHPSVGLIGCEPFVDGVVKVVDVVATRSMGNVRLHADDARDVLRWLPPASIGRAFVLFPDPWPKRRHQKRRLVSAGLLDLLARCLKPDAELRIGTDIPDYVRSILVAALPHPAFVWPAMGPADWQQSPADWPPTRYEQKALREGRRPVYLVFRRRPDNS